MTRARDLAAFVSNADGDIKFDTDTLFIDSSANRVGIGNTAPDTMIHGLNATAPVLKLERDSTSLANNNIIGEVRMSHKDSNDAGDAVRIIGRAEGTAGAAGLAFTTGTPSSNAERMRIDSSGRMGVNTTPDGWSSLTGIDVGQSAGFHGHASDEAAYVSNNLYFDGSNWKAKNTDESQLILLTSTSGSNHIAFYANASVSADANVTLDEHLRIDSDGIKFNGDTAAANALDDYETGNWTPTLPNGGSASNNYSSYVKIGDLVTASAYISASSIPNNSSQFQIGGLPFTAHSNSNYYAGGSLSYSEGFNTNVFTDPLVRNGNTYLYFHRNDGNASAINNNNITGATRYLIFQVTYHTQIP